MKELIEKLKDAFGEKHIEQCLSSTKESLFFVFENEDTKKSEMQKEELEKSFRVRNPQQKVVYLLAIDEGLVPTENYTEERCDFALFSSDKICFVELKLNATSQRRIRENIKKGYSQIIKTLKLLSENDIDLSNYQLEAYIVSPEELRQAILRAPAESNAREAKFEKLYGGKLFDKKNETEF